MRRSPTARRLRRVREAPRQARSMTSRHRAKAARARSSARAAPPPGHLPTRARCPTAAKGAERFAAPWPQATRRSPCRCRSWPAIRRAPRNAPRDRSVRGSPPAMRRRRRGAFFIGGGVAGGNRAFELALRRPRILGDRFQLHGECLHLGSDLLGLLREPAFVLARELQLLLEPSDLRIRGVERTLLLVQ